MTQQQRFFVSVGAAILVLSNVVRFISYPVVTSDYTYFLSKWFDALAQHSGLSAFNMPFSDYSPLYLYLLKILTFLPISSLSSIKTLSLLFDILLALIVVKIFQKTKPSYGRGTLFLIFCLVMSIPTLVLNDSLWGQSDVIYTTGVIASLYFILIDRPLPAVLSFALAFCIKIQSIFFLPILVGYLLRKRAFWQLLYVPALYVVSIIPAWLGSGAFLYWFFIYIHQAGEYTGLAVSSQSVFAFVNGLLLSASVQDLFFYLGLFIALVCAVVITIMMARTPITASARVVLLSALCVTIIPYFLPRMHERYFFLADILSMLYAFYVPRRWYLPLIVILSSVLSYVPYLSGQLAWLAPVHIDLRIPSFLLIVAIVISAVLVRLHVRAVHADTYL